jgi:hypothetical protein
MTARIVRSGVARFDVFALDVREDGRNVTTVIDANPEIDAARTFHGKRVRVTIELEPPPPEPLTGGDADIGARVRVKSDWAGGSFLGGKTGVLTQYSLDQHALVMLDKDGRHYIIPNARTAALRR